MTDKDWAPKKGELVMVGNTQNDYYYTQKFVIKHNGLYYCERDDNNDTLVGWIYCIPNQGHPYYKNGNIAE
jgi:hypothetical protein